MILQIIRFSYQIIKGQLRTRYLPSGSHDESDLSLGLHEEVALSLSLSLGFNNRASGLGVLFVILLSVGDKDLSLIDSFLFVFGSPFLQFFQDFGVSGGFFLDVLRHNSDSLPECSARQLTWEAYLLLNI